MKAIGFAKGMLFAYCKIPELLNEIDRCVDNYAVNSTNINYTVMHSAYDYTQRIIRCAERKKKLIILYKKIEAAFLCCGEHTQKLLCQKYFEGKNVSELCKVHKVSIRTIYRHVESALLQFARKLSKEGATDQEYLNSLKGEIWLTNVMHRIKQSTRGRKV